MFSYTPSLFHPSLAGRLVIESIDNDTKRKKGKKGMIKTKTKTKREKKKKKTIYKTSSMISVVYFGQKFHSIKFRNMIVTKHDVKSDQTAI